MHASSEAVDVDQVLNQLGPARLSMVILDACRNNPFERKFRSGAGGGLAQIDAPTGTLLAYATAPGKVAADGSGSNGLYTEALLKALDLRGLKVEDVFKQVRINVLKASDNQQIPWESSPLIVVNGSLQEKNFLEMAKRFGKQDIATVRQAYVQSMAKDPIEFRLGSATAGSGSAIPRMAFVPPRD